MATWRPREHRPDKPVGDRPSLEAVLEHYDVHVHQRNIQMIQCPLHEDRHPSCSIKLDDDLWKCHSCGKGGTSWDLLMEKEGVTFERARALAAQLGLTAGSAERGGEPVSGGSYFRRRSVPAAKGNQSRNSGYKPSWRRK